MNGAMATSEPEPKPAADPPPQRTGPLPPPSVPPMRGIARSEYGRDPIMGLPTPPPDVNPFDPLVHSAPVGFSPDKAVSEQLAALESWAETNEKDAMAGVTRFWLLKGPAFVCAVAASAAESFGQGRAVIVLGAVAALAIAIDAAWSGPAVQVNRRAIHDIRSLQNAVKLKWDKVRISHPDAKDPARSSEALAILDTIQARREEITRYLASPQSSPPIEPTF
jgi:hypothetical protein